MAAWSPPVFGKITPENKAAIILPCAVTNVASDVPDFRIIKEPRLAKKQGAWAITGRGGSIVKRGQTLENVLGHFRKKLMRLVD